MKHQVIFLFSYLALVNAQMGGPGVPDINPGVPEVVFDNVSAPDSNSTEPSSAPIDDEETSVPAPSMEPVPVPLPPPAPAPEVNDCSTQVCDPKDAGACETNCRPGLECRRRGVGVFICSQVSRTERQRLSGSEGIGGAAGRDRSGRRDIGGLRAR